MPIIPSNWVSNTIVNTIGSNSSQKPFKYVQSFTVNSSNLIDYQLLIGKVETDINREFSIEVISGKIDFYWVNPDDELFIISQKLLVSSSELKDTNLDCLGVSFKCYEQSSFFVTLRWDTDTNFFIYSNPPITEDDFFSNIIDSENWIRELNVISVPTKPVYVNVIGFNTSNVNLIVTPVIDGSYDHANNRVLGLTSDLSEFNDYSNLWDNFTLGNYVFSVDDGYESLLLWITSIIQEDNRWLITTDV